MWPSLPALPSTPRAGFPGLLSSPSCLAFCEASYLASRSFIWASGALLSMAFCKASASGLGWPKKPTDRGRRRCYCRRRFGRHRDCGCGRTSCPCRCRSRHHAAHPYFLDQRLDGVPVGVVGKAKLIPNAIHHALLHLRRVKIAAATAATAAAAAIAAATAVLRGNRA